MTITKSRDDSCSSFLRATLIRKEKRSAISSQFMKSSRIHKHNRIHQQSDEFIQDFSSTPLLQNSIQKEMLSFLSKKDTNKTSTFISQKVPPKYWTFFANHITQMTEITTCQKNLNNDILLSSNQSRCWKCPRTVPLSCTCHSCHQKKAKHIMVDMRSTQPLKKHLTFLSNATLNS